MGGMCALTQITSQETPNKRMQLDTLLLASLAACAADAGRYTS